MRSKHRALHFACALLAVGISAPATAELLLDADAGVLYDSNLNRAHSSADIRAGGAFTLSAVGGSHFALSGADGLTLTANARGEIYHRFHGLNLLGLGGTALYRHKFGLGYAAPWILLAATASHDNYRENIRDSDRVELRAEIGKRFTDAFDVAFGGQSERRYAKNDQPVVPRISGKVFDLSAQSAYARAGYAISNPLLLGVELAVRRGDVVATTRRDFQIFAVSSAIAPDPTFGSDFFAYRLRGTTDTAKVTASWALDDRSSLNFAYADERSDASGGIIYRSHSANLVFAWRY
ncbi:MAG: hypothetical protein M3R31_02580 [Pseudomonadota bacterium]|nr:hypothetical protein [Pseudomonadota bacterium]